METARTWNPDVLHISTRGEAPAISFTDAMLAGLARDGGLYLPQSWPKLSHGEIAALAGLSYAQTAESVVGALAGDSLARPALRETITAAYAAFRHPAVCPLVQIGDNLFLLELFHGPTLAFKDVAMRLLAGLMDAALAERGQRVTIVGATSGDTGSAAIDAFAGSERADVFILYPHGRVSEVQRRQMTTPDAPNVHAIAVEGTFDDCQALVKAMFNHHAFRDRLSLSGVNSINWARIAAQTVYYFTGAVALGAPHRPVSFMVPTGNFGNVLAGFVAKRMGLPIERLAIATNDNDILARTLEDGHYAVKGVIQTASPSMDIEVSSNFERLLFEAFGRDAASVRAAMASLGQSGSFSLKAEALASIREEFDGYRTRAPEAAAAMREVWGEAGYLLDPHTAVAVHAAKRALARDKATPMIALATAHPAKFPEAVAAATGQRPGVPPHLQELMTRKERVTVLANDRKAVESFVEKHARAARSPADHPG
ncbi:threonine synthase [Rhizobiales bacterium GAS191]|nr:threonine synthase [Rhizobiales bacterium GAS191]